MSVVVFGSINMDLVTLTPRLPKPGETLINAFATVPGGKGANQAVACARLGAPTRMIGRVGDDVFGQTLRASLKGYGVDVTVVVTHPGVSSGVAAIEVDDAGENNIVVVPGANGTFGSDDAKRREAALADSTVLLVQLEISLAVTMTAMRSARERGVVVILDPAPARLLPPEVYRLADVITPNETEVASLVGFPVNMESDAEHAAQVLLERGTPNVIVKMGSKGAYWSDGQSTRFIPAFQVQAIDTVGAGDAFNGGLAVALSEKIAFEEPIYWGVAAGALSVTKAGAQPLMPDRAALLTLLADR